MSIKTLNTKILARLMPLTVAILLMVVNIFLNKELGFRGDSYEMWEVAKTFMIGEGAYHSFVEYRGVGAFAFFSVIYKFSDFLNFNDTFFLRLINAIIFIAISCYLIPRIFEEIFKCEVKTVQKTIFVGILFLFFSGYFLYPSNDVMGVFFTLISYLLICKISVNNFVRDSIFSAFCIIMATQMRTNFIVLLPFFCLAVIYKIRELEVISQKKIVKMFSVFLIAIIIFLGLFNIFENIYDFYFKLPFTDLLTISKYRDGVFTRALGWGVLTQKAEWNIGPNYNGAIYYTDRIGTYLFESEFPGRLNMEGFTLLEYCRFIFKYPFEMIMLYGRHLFLAFDIKYSSVYILDMDKGTIIRSLINYILLFCSGVFFIKGKIWKLNKLFNVFIVSLIFLVFSSTPLIQETRFVMLPLIILYSISVFGFSQSDEYDIVFKSKIIYIYMIIFIITMFTISSLFVGYIDGCVILMK